MEYNIKKIEQINFGLMSPEDIREMSVVKIETPDTYDEDGYPIENGLMDPHLGVIDPSLKCRSCSFRGGECQGHFGSIELARPVIHVGFGDIIHKILRSTCNECGRVLLTDSEIEYFTEQIREAQENKESLNNILKEVQKVAKRDVCPYCEAKQERIFIDKPVSIRQEDYRLTPAEVRERLERIPDGDAYVLGVNPEVARPEWMVLTVLPAPPVTIRPSITLDTGERSEDDLTHKLVDVIRINQRLIENMEAGAPSLIVDDLWELLQYHVITYFDNEASGVPPARHRSGRPLKTLTQRLKGKEGRFRSNLSGKRVNFSARTVISPDPNISINEVGVPEMIAKEVTVPTYVNEWNIDEMRKYIENGPDKYPGARYVIRTDGRKIRVLEETKELIIEQLEPGYIIERHLKDGDIVLFNRQPSLHRMSMMAHEVRVLPYKTFRLNLCVCPPYNADFDGDEMNMHILQTDESRAEAKSLMRVQEHILSPRFGGPIIGAIHDHISGAYLLTRDGVEFTEEQALQIIRKSHLKMPEFKSGHWILKYDIDYSEESYIYKEKDELWTGKELFSLLLPNDLNITYTAEIAKCPAVYPAEDAQVVIKNGILEQGVIDESAYGSFSGKILDKIVKDYGPGRAKEFLDRSTDLAICGIMKTGITTSLNDEDIPREAQDRINEHLDNKMAEVDKLVESYEEGYLRPLPGRSLEETLEMRIMQVLGEARDMSGNIAENYLIMGKQSDDDPYDHVMAVENHSVVMARTGARASMLNLTQISACVGQQVVRGARIERGYIKRTLPHFKKGDVGAKAKGFVHSSYRSGLDPIEFFFHAVGGREGLVDTAIRTAQSGYMQRRLVNALQDLQVKPSGVVIDNEGMVIQTMFGEDGVDPAKSDFGKAANLDKLIDEIKLNNEINDILPKNEVQNEPKEMESFEYELYDELREFTINTIGVSADKVKEESEKLSPIIYEFYDTHRILFAGLEAGTNTFKDIKKAFKDYRGYGFENDIDYSYFMVDLSYELREFTVNAFNVSFDKIKEESGKLSPIIYEFYDTHRILFEGLEKGANTFEDIERAFISYMYKLESSTTDKDVPYTNEEIIFEDTYVNPLKEFIIITSLPKSEEIKEESEILSPLLYEFYDTHRYLFGGLEAGVNTFENIKQELRIFLDKKELATLEDSSSANNTSTAKLNESEDIKLLISKFKQFLKNPFLSHDLRRFNLLTEEIESIERNIIEDITNGKIKDKNPDFKLILISYCETYNKNNYVLSDDELDEILSEGNLNDIFPPIINECKLKVKNDYESGIITKNQILIKFNKLVDKKIDELDKLEELEKIRNNPDWPDIKQYLSKDDCISIYNQAEEKICSEHGLRGPVSTYIENQMNRKNEKNKSEAREEFKRFRRNKNHFLELTHLEDEQIEFFVKEVEILIGENKIMTNDFNEEFIKELSSKFITYGRIIL